VLAGKRLMMAPAINLNAVTAFRLKLLPEMLPETASAATITWKPVSVKSFVERYNK
jgi:hypothetical protein